MLTSEEKAASIREVIKRLAKVLTFPQSMDNEAERKRLRSDLLEMRNRPSAAK